MQDTKGDKEKLLAQYNFQANILIEDKLNAILSLPNEEMQSTMIEVIKKNTEHQMNIENRIITMHEEKHRQNIKDREQGRILRYVGAGVAIAFSGLIFMLSYFLFESDKDVAGSIVAALVPAMMVCLNFFKKS